MPSRNASRVAVTRSRPRIRPTEIVAPDRDTPGINARHWAPPMIRESSQVQVLLAAVLLGDRLRDQHHDTPDDQGEGDHPQGPQRARDQVPARTPTMTIGIDPMITSQAIR